MEYNKYLPTPFYDKRGSKISVGDVLKTKWGYSCLVCIDKDGDYYGSLICEIGDSCRNARYSLGDSVNSEIMFNIYVQQIYDKMCRVLTEYEQDDTKSMENNLADMYDVLANIQNAWETVITVKE